VHKYEIKGDLELSPTPEKDEEGDMNLSMQEIPTAEEFGS